MAVAVCCVVAVIAYMSIMFVIAVKVDPTSGLIWSLFAGGIIIWALIVFIQIKLNGSPSSKSIYVRENEDERTTIQRR